MCTSLIYETLDKTQFLARTMDFSFELEANPVYIPKGYVFTSDVGPNVTFEAKYAFIGAGRKLHEYFFADGLNEVGLAICSLYFRDYAVYSEEEVADKVNIAPHELISWVLGNIDSVATMKQRIADINIVAIENSLLQIVVPLHWIISDKTGASIILEITKTGVHIYDNQVRVMANIPEYPWHLANLNHYSFLNNTVKPASHFYKFKPQEGELGNGSMGMPGDYTSESRFIRTVFHAEFTKPVETAEEGVNSLMHILSSVNIPYGVKLKVDNTIDYTQYTSVMDTTHLDYYMATYQDTYPAKVSLNESLLNHNEPIVFEASRKQQFNVLIP